MSGSDLKRPRGPQLLGVRDAHWKPALPRLRPDGAPAVLPNTLAVYLVAAFSNGG